MKTENLNLVALTNSELLSIDGGSFFEDLAYVTAYTLHVILEMGKIASEFQHSLPANLKK